MKNVLKALAALSLGLALVACKKENAPEVAPVYTLEAGTFNDDLVATITVKADKVAAADVQVALSLTEETTFPENSLELPENLTVKAGEMSAQVDLKIVTVPDEGGDYKAVVAAKVGEKELTAVTVNYTKVPELRFERVWGLYNSGSDADWFKNITADGAGVAATTDRNIAIDDDYIYLAKSSAYPQIFAIDRTDPSKVKKLDITGVAGGTHAVSCVRVVKNTDSSINGGKDILLFSNLKGDYQLKVYAYLNGIDKAPVQVLEWQWDNWAGASCWRRYGDKFTVTGTWQKGALWFQGQSDGKAVYFPLKGGIEKDKCVDKAGEVSHVIDASANTIKDIAVYPGQEATVLVTSWSKAAFWTNSGSKNANNWITWTEGDAMPSLKNTYGYQFFTFKDKKYIAYTLLESTKKSRVQIMEDNGNFKTSLEAKAGLMEAPLQNASDYAAASPAEGGNNGDCAVRVIDEEVYIASMHQDVGLSLFKMYMK